MLVNHDGEAQSKSATQGLAARIWSQAQCVQVRRVESMATTQLRSRLSDEVRPWIRANLPDDLRTIVTNYSQLEREIFHAAPYLGRQGRIAPHWDAEWVVSELDRRCALFLEIDVARRLAVR